MRFQSSSLNMDYLTMPLRLIDVSIILEWASCFELSTR